MFYGYFLIISEVCFRVICINFHENSMNKCYFENRHRSRTRVVLQRPYFKPTVNHTTDHAVDWNRSPSPFILRFFSFSWNAISNRTGPPGKVIKDHTIFQITETPEAVRLHYLPTPLDEERAKVIDFRQLNNCDVWVEAGGMGGRAKMRSPRKLNPHQQQQHHWQEDGRSSARFICSVDAKIYGLHRSWPQGLLWV